MTLAKVTTVNNTTAVILPPEILARLGLSDGDTLQVRETHAASSSPPAVLNSIGK